MSQDLAPRTVQLLEHAPGDRVVVAANKPFPAILYLGVFVLAGPRGIVAEGRVALAVALLGGLGLAVLVGGSPDLMGTRAQRTYTSMEASPPSEYTRATELMVLNFPASHLRAAQAAGETGAWPRWTP